MDKPENGLYMARVTDDSVHTMHADEDAVCDHQTGKIFKDRDKIAANQEREAAQRMREADEQAKKAACQAARKKRCFWYMVKDVLGLLGAASLVALTYRFGLYVAIASITGCCVAASCRLVGYVERGGNA